MYKVIGFRGSGFRGWGSDWVPTPFLALDPETVGSQNPRPYLDPPTSLYKNPKYRLLRAIRASLKGHWGVLV